ncbi:hypothetical protein CesoFtcFv8_023423 [Champsocephalus esox]|uniref:Uncharacterized protein n=1 Tax=Champsocephalus esox TaxID=159716 RepID=A0AAN8B872_9TELE|nr:hypothetical protein CesoFtcFv8_023423 [Champsocephalus esox]
MLPGCWGNAGAAECGSTMPSLGSEEEDLNHSYPLEQRRPSSRKRRSGGRDRMKEWDGKRGIENVRGGGSIQAYGGHVTEDVLCD